MFPNQPNQPGGQQPYVPPQPVQPQQNAQGAYDVLPPIAAGVNGGHSGHNPYEFIVNPNTAPRKSGLFGGNAFLQKIIIIVAGAVLLMVMAAIVLNAALPNKSGSASLTGIIQKQQEIVRVATIGSAQGVSQATLNFAANIQAAVTTSLSNTTAYASEHGVKLDKKTLALGRVASTDTTLSTATATNTFDTAFQEIMVKQLQSYQATVKTAYTETSRTELKTLLKQDYTTAATLLKQVNQ